MEISEIKDKEEANRVLSAKLEQINAMIKECEEISKKFDCSFSLPFYPSAENPDDAWQPSEGWEPSQICY